MDLLVRDTDAVPFLLTHNWSYLIFFDFINMQQTY